MRSAGRGSLMALDPVAVIVEDLRQFQIALGFKAFSAIFCILGIFIVAIKRSEARRCFYCNFDAGLHFFDFFRASANSHDLSLCLRCGPEAAVRYC